MIRSLIAKEVLEGIRGYKFVLALLLALTSIPFVLYVGTQRHQIELAEAREANRDALQAFQAQPAKPPHSAAHFGMAVTKQPSPLTAFANGVHDVLGSRAELDPHLPPRLSGGTSDRTPILSLFGTLDYAFLIQVVFGLFALLLSFDLVSGEREAGTLKVILSNPVARSQLILGKLVGGSLVLLLPVVLATLIGLLFFTPLAGVELSDGDWLRILGIVGLSILYLLMMFLAGLFVSILTRQRVTSLLVLLIAWVVLIFVVPRSAATLAQHLQEIPAGEEVAAQLREIREDEANKYRARAQQYAQENPLYTIQTLPPELQVANRRQMDEAVEERSSQVFRAVDAAQNRQVAVAANLARLSPATAYRLAVTDLASTGVSRHQQFLRSLDEYRRQFVGHFDELERRGVTTVSDFSDVPVFEEPFLDPRADFRRIVLDAGLLTGVSLLLFTAAYVAFLRCDVR